MNGTAAQKEKGVADVVKVNIPTASETTKNLRDQAKAYGAAIEANLNEKGTTPDVVNKKVKRVAEALGFWDEEKGITDVKKFAARVVEVLNNTVDFFILTNKKAEKVNDITYLTEAAKTGSSETKFVYISFEECEGKKCVSDEALKLVIDGFGKYLDKQDIAVKFKGGYPQTDPETKEQTVSYAEYDEQGGIKITLDWKGDVKPVDFGTIKPTGEEAMNEFTGKKKGRLNLPEVVPRKVA